MYISNIIQMFHLYVIIQIVDISEDIIVIKTVTFKIPQYQNENLFLYWDCYSKSTRFL